jgi:hypothetical protein
MDDKFLRDARLMAEKSVSDMPEGDLKLKAFEVTLQHLLAAGASHAVTNGKARGSKRVATSAPGQANTLSERILMLQADGFFDTPKVIGAVREGLQVYGWHYPVTTLSGTLQALVQRRKLRRERVKDNNKVVWKYSNP